MCVILSAIFTVVYGVESDDQGYTQQTAITDVFCFNKFQGQFGAVNGDSHVRSFRGRVLAGICF